MGLIEAGGEHRRMAWNNGINGDWGEIDPGYNFRYFVIEQNAREVGILVVDHSSKPGDVKHHWFMYAKAAQGSASPLTGSHNLGEYAYMGVGYVLQTSTKFHSSSTASPNGNPFDPVAYSQKLKNAGIPNARQSIDITKAQFTVVT